MRTIQISENTDKLRVLITCFFCIILVNYKYFTGATNELYLLVRICMYVYETHISIKMQIKKPHCVLLSLKIIHFKHD